jgi:capsular polysaccharide biosynthesis protein
MTKGPARSGDLREILRWWPLVIVPALIALTASIWSAGQQVPSYTATTRLLVVPIAQWDETFLGISLVRDAGDTQRTAATVATVLSSRHAATVAADYLGDDWTPQSVEGAVKVSVTEKTNVINIVARSADAERAVQLAQGFARATLADRWRTISTELNTRIAAISDTTAADPNAGTASARLQTLTLIRASGSDPTLTLDSTSPAVRDQQLPMTVVVGLATAGGLFVGLLAAVGIARLRRGTSLTTAEPTLHPDRTPAYAPNGES